MVNGRIGMVAAGNTVDMVGSILMQAVAEGGGEVEVGVGSHVTASLLGNHLSNDAWSQ
jgi:hypothetical protein